MAVASLLIALLALAVSGGTLYFTLFHRGTLKMTQPTTFFLGPDGRAGLSDTPKVFLRTLLYSTAKRGQVIENMYVELVHDSDLRLFNIWVYGDRDGLVRGSGLFVDDQGVAANHHFLLPKSDAFTFQFLAGDYTLRVFATLTGQKTALKLGEFSLTIDNDQFFALAEHDVGIFFDWMPDARTYHGHADRAPKLTPGHP